MLFRSKMIKSTTFLFFIFTLMLLSKIFFGKLSYPLIRSKDLICLLAILANEAKIVTRLVRLQKRTKGEGEDPAKEVWSMI